MYQHFQDLKADEGKQWRQVNAGDGWNDPLYRSEYRVGETVQQRTYRGIGTRVYPAEDDLDQDREDENVDQ